MTPPVAPLLSRVVDRGTGVTGLVVVLLALVADPVVPPAWAWACGVLVVLGCRWPLTLPTGSADALLVGLEACLLLFLGLLLAPSAALLVYAVAVTVAEALSAHMRDTRSFNTGVRVLAGGAALLVLSALVHDAAHPRSALLAVLLAASAYFVVDYTWSAVSIAAAEQQPLRGFLQLRSCALGLAGFVVLNSAAFLAWQVVLELSWTALLLLVPFGALLAASHSWSTMRRAGELSAALSDAAVALQAAQDTGEVEQLLTDHAAQVARAPRAALGPARGDARLVFAPSGAARRVLALDQRHSQEPYSEAELQAVELLLRLALQAHERLGLLARLRYSADHDALTGLVGRRRFEQLLGEAVAQDRPVALLFCDLDRFKQVNDEHGHAAGDAVLVQVARRLERVARVGDTCARLGGDEFVVLLELDPAAADEQACASLLERVRGAITTTVEHEGAVLSISGSVGLVRRTDQDADAMVHDADAAMYADKSRRRALAGVPAPV